MVFTARELRQRRRDRYFYTALLVVYAFAFGAMVAAGQSTVDFWTGVLWGVLLSYVVTKFVIACRDR